MVWRSVAGDRCAGSGVKRLLGRRGRVGSEEGWPESTSLAVVVVGRGRNSAGHGRGSGIVFHTSFRIRNSWICRTRKTNELRFWKTEHDDSFNLPFVLFNGLHARSPLKPNINLPCTHCPVSMTSSPPLLLLPLTSSVAEFIFSGTLRMLHTGPAVASL